MPKSPEALPAAVALEAPADALALARAPRVALKAKRGAFAAGAWGVEDEGGWAPTPTDDEDGLVLWVDGQPWRILERLAFQVQANGTLLPLKLRAHEATPHSATWWLEGEGYRLRFALAMVDREAWATSAWRASWNLEAGSGPLNLIVRPYLDMRAPTEAPDAARHRVHPHDGQRVSVVHHNRWAVFGWQNPVAYQAERRVLNSPSTPSTPPLHRLPPLPHPKPLVPGAWQVPLVKGQSQSLWVTAEHGQKKATEALEAYLADGEAWLAQDLASDTANVVQLATLPAVAQARVVALVRHLAWPTNLQGRLATAGWGTLPILTRDWVEGVWHNRATWAAMGAQGALVAMIDHGLNLLEANQGRFPRWLDGRRRGEAPAAGDAEAMFFTLAGEVLGADGGGAGRRARLAQAAWAILNGSMDGRLTTRFGHPVLLESGLLAMHPGASWMDALHDVQVEGRTVLDLPARVPESWVREAAAKVSDAQYLWEQLQYPNALFPEANAWWLRMLAAAKPWVEAELEAADLAEWQSVEASARAAYGPTFWNAHQGSLFNLVTTERKTDGTPSAGAVVAAALLPDGVLERAQLERTWLAARDRLLVKRAVGAQALPLGLLARDAGAKRFLGPAQAHDAVVHSATTPYLFTLLRRLGQDATARDLLLANLHAQSTEGSPFLQSEAFGWPVGAEEALPLGAPAAWCAQWCDPFLEMAPALSASWPPV